MSWAFMTALQKDPHQSYVELLNSIRDLLEDKYSQLPQLSTSHPMGEFIYGGRSSPWTLLTAFLDTNLLFII